MFGVTREQKSGPGRITCLGPFDFLILIFGFTVGVSLHDPGNLARIGEVHV